jgi:hypothetical protein
VLVKMGVSLSLVPEIDSRLLMCFIPYSDKWKWKKGRPRISLRVLRVRRLRDSMMSLVTLNTAYCYPEFSHVYLFDA